LSDRPRLRRSNALQSYLLPDPEPAVVPSRTEQGEELDPDLFNELDDLFSDD